MEYIVTFIFVQVCKWHVCSGLYALSDHMLGIDMCRMTWSPCPQTFKDFPFHTSSSQKLSLLSWSSFILMRSFLLCQCTTSILGLTTDNDFSSRPSMSSHSQALIAYKAMQPHLCKNRQTFTQDLFKSANSSSVGWSNRDTVSLHPTAAASSATSVT